MMTKFIKNLLKISIYSFFTLATYYVAEVAVADFTNGGFETGDFTGWTTHTYLNNSPTLSNPIENTPRSALNTGVGGTNGFFVRTDSTRESQYDSNLGPSSTLRYPRYGNDTAVVNYYLTSSRNVNSITQTMTITTADVDPFDNKPHIRFAVAPVLEDGSHDPDEQPYFFVNVRNVTQNSVLFNTFKYANQPGVPWKTGTGDFVYTDWQLIDVSPSAGQLEVGDQVEVEVLASRCQPSGHTGYVYVDGVGSFLPGISVVAYGPESANSNSNITYTYYYRNGESTAVSNAIVTINLPSNTTYQSISANGASCTTPSINGTGAVTCNVGTLNKNASGSLSLTLKINNAATGTISHGNYNIDSDQTSALIGPLVLTTITSGITYADLKADITDGLAAAGWGQPISFALTVTNNGPSTANGATVSYTVPAQLTGVSWTCSGTGGATCTSSGSGNISDSVNLPSGGTVTYAIDANVISGTGSATMVNTATVTAPGGVTDNVSSNNTAVDTDPIGTLYELTVTKSAAAGGTVSSVPAAISCGTSCASTSAEFVNGASVTLSAVAATNFEFTSWGGACSGTSPVTDPCTLTVTADTAASANFNCTTGRYGATCGSVCPGSGNCSGHGTCSSGTSGTGACTCNANYAGSDCSQTDTDNDGVADGSDCAPSDATRWRDQAYPDSDLDGIRNSTSLTTVACFGTTPPSGSTLTTNGPDNCTGVSNSSQLDTDTDGQGDACDTDDDNDSVLDVNDCAVLDATKWRDQAYDDSDLDGIRNSTSLSTTSCYGNTVPAGYTLSTNGPDNCTSISNANQLDSDNDGQGDACDSDKDGDGIPDSVEGTSDKDGDGIPNDLDLDSDGDGITDAIEGSNDKDGDGIPNFLDLDSDGDSIPDSVEGNIDTDSDGTPNFLDADSDGDGVGDVFETAVDSDGDGTPDYLDLDADGDGTPDSTEAFDNDGDGKVDVSPVGVDSDGNGIDDAFDNRQSPELMPGYWRDSKNGRGLCTVLDISQSVRKAKRTAGVLRARALSFSKRAEGCGSASLSAMRRAANKNYNKYLAMVDGSIGDETMSCSMNVCSTHSTSSDKAEMSKILKKIFNNSLAAKKSSIASCPAPKSDGKPDKRKNTVDYMKDAKQAIKDMPASLTNC